MTPRTKRLGRSPLALIHPQACDEGATKSVYNILCNAVPIGEAFLQDRVRSKDRLQHIGSMRSRVVPPDAARPRRPSSVDLSNASRYFPHAPVETREPHIVLRTPLCMTVTLGMLCYPLSQLARAHPKAVVVRPSPREPRVLDDEPCLQLSIGIEAHRKGQRSRCRDRR